MIRNTLYALSSGAGRAGVAVVRLSGPGAAFALEALCGPLPAPRRASLRSIRAPETGEILDEALVLWFPAPQSFTAEDMGELQVHGGRAVAAAVLAALSTLPGLRPAEPGEFTRRAFLNGRLDLLEAEGLGALIDAETDAQRRLAEFHRSGGASRVLEGWRRDLVGVLARLEAAIDFPDEDGVERAAMQGLLQRLLGLRNAMRTELARPGAEQVQEGLRVVLAGPVNAGKSSLLNRIVGRDAAIVSALPGTTRDVVEARLELGGLLVHLADTAGLREMPGDEVEAEGMNRSQARIRAADLVLWVSEPTALAPPPDSFDSETLWIGSKADLIAAPERASGPALWISARSGEGLDSLLAEIERRALSLSQESGSLLLVRERHRSAARACCAAIESAAARWDGPIELVADDVRRAAEALGRLTGRIDSEAILDEIFGAFCIGK
ncbi:MAG: tRNA uridine-5-carboxymethylaminomethyl(34) synthesis GTPase MnmE [Parvibaculaceae bacterium]